MPGMLGSRAKARARKNARAHVRMAHATLRKAVKKLVTARILGNRGKTARAKKAAKIGQRALRRAVGHYTKAAHAKARVRTARFKGRFTARKRGGGGGGGLLGSLGGIVSGLLGGI